MVRLLLEYGADANAVSRSGRTLLEWACDRRAVELFKLLLEYGADSSVPFSDGETPLEAALQEGQFEIVKLLSETRNS
jgi:ankyrin repeat protein